MISPELLATFPPPPLRAQKPDFTALPQHLCADICALAGGRAVISADTVYGGFSAAACWRVTFDNGCKAFIKGSHPADPSHGAANLRGEIAAHKNNLFIAQNAPPLIGMVSHDSGDDNGWWLGLWRDAGESQGDIAAKDALAWLERLRGADPAGLPAYHENPYLAGFFNNSRKWRQLEKSAVARQRFENLFVDGQHWLARCLPALIAQTDKIENVSFETGLIHGDLRGDNFLVTREKTYLVDWANAASGPLVFDAVFLTAALMMRGQLAPKQAADVLKPYPQAGIMAASCAGYFADHAPRAPVVAMPRLRLMQQGMLLALLEILLVFGIIDSLPAARAVLAQGSANT